MDLLINWVTQIIVFLIFAAIIDLLIPANKMKRYIQFVVGLILLLIFLKPVFYMFNIDIPQAIETSFKEYLQTDEKVENMDEMIKIQKSEIESTQDAYILEEMVVQLENLAEEPLAEEQIELSDIQFSFAESGNYTFENLEEIIVYLAAINEEEGVVDDIEEVDINTEEPKLDEEELEDIDTESIKNILQEVWELDDMKITVVWEEGVT
ncbi:stage III sporulation protein AF [Virgibacillus sp. MSJ-26]|uniref:stage III sporulation protein AF n=1 Tax=Virgibacillus sp. MSJ-26 TaxID=2841522 RepID=UPI001C0F61F1|nr:stage III sporulation protein AF [Virgibacillus sp. MSJ-26]MBU5466364.1 stage III sporulation protein AF [Virgibacillus sp. MSJ-26]